jgi:hypothetical protein
MQMRYTSDRLKPMAISYPLFWGVALGVIGGMLWWFRSRKWF